MRSAGVSAKVVLATAAFAAAFAPGSSGSAPEPQEVAELVVDVHVGGRPVVDLAAEDLEVFEDGRPVEILALEPLAGYAGLAGRRRGELRSSSDTPWRLVVYFDPALITRRSQFRTAKALSAQADALVALGSVEVVMAAPEPEVRLGRTRDPKLVRATLQEVALAATGAEDLATLRTLFRRAGEVPSRQRIVDAVDREAKLVAQRLGVLEEWLRERPTGGYPAAIFWICDGFETDPAPFYLRGGVAGEPPAALAEELASRPGLAALETLARVMVDGGWTAIPTAFGAWPTAAGVDLRKLFVDPRRPLAALAFETAGAVAHKPSHVAAALLRLGRRWRLAYAAPQGFGERWVEVRPRRPKLAARAALRRPAAVPAEVASASRIDTRWLPPVPGAKAVYLSPLAEATVAGRTLVRAQAVDPDVAAVGFEVDGRPKARVKKAPFETWITFPKLPEPRTLRAVAYDAAGAELGADELTVNRSLDAHRVEIRAPRAIRRPGRFEVEVAVQAPPRRRALEVALWWNDKRLASFAHPPYRHSLEVTDVASTGILRAVATFDDGVTAEDVLLAGRVGFSAQVEVDLVELYTVVEDRHGRLVPALGREDFEVHEDGVAQAVRDFQHPVETPLSLGLVIDVSGSMTDDLPLVRRAAWDFLRKVLGDGDRALLVAFADEPHLLQPLTGDPDRLASVVGRLGISGGTAIFDTAVFSVLELRAVPGRKALVLLTDGDDTTSRHSFEQCFEFARRAGIPIYVIGIGTSWIGDRQRMKRLAAVTGGTNYQIDQAEELAGAYAAIAEELRSQYLLTYAPPERDRSGWRTIEVKVRPAGLEARTATGYYVP